MKDKLEAGIYVRTKYNGIGKIVEYINDPTHYFFKCYKLDRNCFNCEEYITESDVIGKPSYNIIDLLQIGDIISFKNEFGSIEIKDIHNSVAMQMIKDKEIDIKSIVTKEQFESMSYKLED